MDLRSRRILYSVAIAVFCITGPLLLLYAQGFRIDFSNRQVVKTGSLAISTTPPSASVMLDGRSRPNSTPLLLESMVPGRYSVSISKKGYKSLQTSAVIEPRNTTSIDTALLPESPLRATIAVPFTVIGMHTSRHDASIWIIGRNAEGIQLFRTDRQLSVFTTVATFNNVPSSDPAYSWSSQSRYLALRWHDGTLLLWDTEKDMLAYSSRDVQEIQWDIEIESVVYLLIDTTWWRIDLFNTSSRVVASGEGTLLYPRSNALVVSHNFSDRTIIQRFDVRNLSEDGSARLTVDYPVTTIALFGHYVALSDEQEVRLVRPDGVGIAKFPIAQVKKMDVTSDNRALLIQTTNELWILNDALKQPLLLLRAGDISAVEWYVENRTLFALHGDTLEAFNTVQPELRPGTLGQIPGGTLLAHGIQKELLASDGAHIYTYEIFL